LTDKKKTPMDTETVVMALDQISQTIDVMTNVVGRLRSYMREQQILESKEPSEALLNGVESQTLH
jgi:hypothetical protein